MKTDLTARSAVVQNSPGLLRARDGRRWRAAMWLILCSTAVALRAQTYTQSITLNPGWNSVFLEVAPTNSAIAAVFNDPGIDSVWTPNVRVTTVSFIQNQNEAPFNRGGWSVYFPASRIESINNDLFGTTVNHGYLVKVTGSNVVTLHVTGRPSLRQLSFDPDAYTLRGFPVDNSAPPTFQTFFGASPAHIDPNSGAVQNIYRLNNASSQWEQVNPGDPMTRGVAYWVYTTGSSSYMGPWSVLPSLGDGLDYGLLADESRLTLRNNTGNPVAVTMTDLSSGARPLSYYQLAPPVFTPSWTPLPQSYGLLVNPGTNLVFRVGVSRGQMASPDYATVLQVSDGLGMRFLVPVTASRPATTAEKTKSFLGRKSVASRSSASPAGIPVELQAGLWVGDVTLNAVAETRVNPSNATPTSATFDLRLMVHVDTNGVTRLLREVIQMYRNGTYTNNASGQKVVSQPGQYVLLTDDSLIPQFQGAASRDGVSVGRRISTATFDFDPPGGTNYLVMTGAFGVSNTVGCAITLTPATPTNPFLHRYHPDHDNLDGDYQPITNPALAEVYTVTRQIQLQFTASDPGGQAAADYGYSSIGGIYQETVTGLNKNPLFCSGTFHLVRVTDTPVLNQ